MSEIDEDNQGEIILYTTAEGTIRLEVFYKDETFWLQNMSKT